MRLIFAAQRRLERGAQGNLRKREFFEDAAALLEVRCMSEGRPLPSWLKDQSEPPLPHKRRRR
jgi:hypothetical protein